MVLGALLHLLVFPFPELSCEGRLFRGREGTERLKHLRIKQCSVKRGFRCNGFSSQVEGWCRQREEREMHFSASVFLSQRKGTHTSVLFL